MTYEELVRKVAESNGMVFRAKGSTAANRGKTLAKTEAIIRDTFALIAQAAREGKSPLLPHLGRVVNKPMRSTGRKPDGTVWTIPGRMKLALVASKEGREEAPAQTAAA